MDDTMMHETNAQPAQKSQAEIKAEKRAAALRNNLKKRKALAKSKQEKADAKS